MTDFVKVAKLSEIPDGGTKQIRASGKVMCLARMGTEVFAIDDMCSHAHCSLATGFLDGTVLVCSCHGGTFDVTTGENIGLPAPTPVASYQVKVEGEDVLVYV